MKQEKTNTMHEDGRGTGGKGVAGARPGVLVLFSEAQVPTSVYSGKGPLTVGRGPDQKVFIEDQGLSRRHATISVDAGGALVRDEGSHNGTHVNGARISREHRADHGDIIRCGSTLMMAVPDSGLYRQWPRMAGRSALQGGPAMEAARKKIEIVAPRDMEVLIQGESGTGKEVAAHLLHRQSKRKGPFVPVNCAAMPEGLFEAELFGARKGAYTGADAERPGLMQAARGGTLFLDEIGELPLSLQPKLLRAVESREVRPLGGERAVKVDFRLVAATNRDLRLEVDEDRFRRDLYHRLCGVLVKIEPLRRRREDIVFFTRQYLKQTAAETGAEPPGMSVLLVERLLLGAWPGNVRELQRTLQQAMVEAEVEGHDTLAREHLGGEEPAAAAPTEQDELSRVREALEHSRGNVAHAAMELGMPRGKVYALLKAHGLSLDTFRR